jgi:hypothetical protein
VTGSRRPSLVGIEGGEPDGTESEHLGSKLERQQQRQQYYPKGLATTTAEDTNPASFRPVH